VGFLSTKQVVDSINTNGSTWHTEWQKVSGVAPYTAGRWYDLTLLSGTPRSNVYPGSMRTATQLNNRSSGNLWHGLSDTNKFVMNMGAWSAVSTAAPSHLMLCDLLLFYPLIDLDDDGLQELNNALALTRYTDGNGVRAYLVTTADAGAVIPTITMSYTNQDGVSGRQLPNPVNLGTLSIVGHLSSSGTVASNYGPFLPLAQGDTGIRSVQSIQLSIGMGGGWATLVLCKPITSMPLVEARVVTENDFIKQFPSLPKIEDSAYLGFILFTGANLAAGTRLGGYVDFIW
jgi:hypothetical protein